jgi:heat shock protein HtpX
MAQGRDLFPADRGLQARMAIASVATPLLVVAGAALVVELAPLKIVGFFFLAVVIGVWLAIAAYRDAEDGLPLAVQETPELHALVERVCVMADLPKPTIVRSPESEPNSWVVARPGRPPELHLTRGLLALLETEELEAVVAHELAHVAHRDAVVMTVVGGPGTVMVQGGQALLRGGFFLLPGALVAMGVGLSARVGTAALSRYRELAADASAAAITGHPAALAHALRKVSGSLQAIPSADLREVAVRDAFNFVAAGDEGRGWLRTHPDVERRIARLEAMERRLHAARLPDLPR